MTANGAIPAWYQKIVNHLTTSQSEVFLLYGDVLGYPLYPGEGLVEFLRRMTLAPFRRQIDSTLDEEDELADKCLFGTISPASGLRLSVAEREAFDRHSPPPSQDNPFAAASSGGMAADFQRLTVYFAAAEAPPLALVVEDADLIFDGDSPVVEPERTLLSTVRSWAAKPLHNSNGQPHRVFLVSPSRVGIRSALIQGRIATAKIPLPDEATRRRFVAQVLEAAEKAERPVALDDLTVDEVARITGALNLQQIEDVVYQAEMEGGSLTRQQVQVRKDELVADQYGSVIEIHYPTAGFEELAGFDELKLYMTDYVRPLLIAGDPLCPKGCILSGPPGTGKTAFARALAASVQLPLVLVQMDKIKSKYVGESNKAMAKMCEAIIALAPAIILADEIDKIMPTSDDNTGVSQELLGAFQTFLSDIPRGKAFFIATTNYPSRIPRALLRPGRFEETIPLLPQHMDGIRDELFYRVARRMALPTDIEDGGWAKVAKEAKDYTGADVERALIKANRLRVMEGADMVTVDHCLKAMNGLVPTVATAQEMVLEALAFCADKSYIPPSMLEQATKAVEETQRRRELRKDVV